MGEVRGVRSLQAARGSLPTLCTLSGPGKPLAQFWDEGKPQPEDCRERKHELKPEAYLPGALEIGIIMHLSYIYQLFKNKLRCV